MPQQIPPLSKPTRLQLAALTAVILLLALTAAVFFPGLTGGLVFDDYGTLGRFQTADPIDDVESIVAFAFSDTSGILRRVITMLSFLMDTQGWPIDTVQLKTTNLLIHLFNTCLVFWLLYTLVPTLFTPCNKTTQLLLVLAGTSLWALNPIQVSTVSYMVQRMAQLSATFSLLGLLVVVKFTQKALIKPILPWKQVIGYSLLFGLTLLLGLFSKENAILACLMGWVIVSAMTQHRALHTGQRPNPQTFPTIHQLWVGLFLKLPIALLGLYLVFNYLFQAEQAYAMREFSLFERVLTQLRVVIIYIGQIVIPRVDEMGLARIDGIAISTSPLHPFTTVLAMGFWGGVAFALKRYYKQYPVLCLGPLLFLSGHLLESTIIPLEVYYEHRNYLALLGLCFTAISLCTLLPKPQVGALMLIAISGIYAINTYHHAQLWGDTIKQTLQWIETHPSERNISMHIVSLQNADQDEAALDWAQKAVQLYPDSFAASMNLYHISCSMGVAKRFPLSQMLEQAKISSDENSWIASLRTLWRKHKSGSPCPGFNDEAFIQLVKTAIEHNTLTMARSNRAIQLYQMAARFYEARGQIAQALTYLDKACQRNCSPSTHLARSVYAIQLRRNQDALNAINEAKRALTWMERLRKPALLGKVLDLEAKLLAVVPARG